MCSEKDRDEEDDREEEDEQDTTDGEDYCTTETGLKFRSGALPIEPVGEARRRHTDGRLVHGLRIGGGTSGADGRGAELLPNHHPARPNGDMAQGGPVQSCLSHGGEVAESSQEEAGTVTPSDIPSDACEQFRILALYAPAVFMQLKRWAIEDRRAERQRAGQRGRRAEKRLSERGPTLTETGVFTIRCEGTLQYEILDPDGRTDHLDGGRAAGGADRQPVERGLA